MSVYEFVDPVVAKRCEIRSWVRDRFNLRYHFAYDSMAWWTSLDLQLLNPVYQASLLLSRKPLGNLLSRSPIGGHTKSGAQCRPRNTKRSSRSFHGADLVILESSNRFGNRSFAFRNDCISIWAVLVGTIIAFCCSKVSVCRVFLANAPHKFASSA